MVLLSDTSTWCVLSSGPVGIFTSWATRGSTNSWHRRSGRRRTMGQRAITTWGQRTVGAVLTCWWSCICWGATLLKLISSSLRQCSSTCVYRRRWRPQRCLRHILRHTQLSPSREVLPSSSHSLTSSGSSCQLLRAVRWLISRSCVSNTSPA